MRFRILKILSMGLLACLAMQSAAIPLQHTTHDPSGDVKLVDGDYGGYTEGDQVNVAEVDITQVDYDYSASDGTLDLIMTLAGSPVFNNSVTYMVTLNINRMEGETLPLKEASFSGVITGSSAAISYGYSYDNGTTDSQTSTVNTTLSGTSISWEVDVSSNPAVDDIFVANATSFLLEGYTEYYPGATTGATNAKFVDEARVEWPVVPDDLSDENKNPLPFPLLGIIAVPAVAVLKRKLQ